ncbi:DmpA/ArgJ-like protein [Hymenopellis radicata]|nr:DmpA/ArgJ-like protein [Hymenopellis radicata]
MGAWKYYSICGLAISPSAYRGGGGRTLNPRLVDKTPGFRAPELDQVRQAALGCVDVIGKGKYGRSTESHFAPSLLEILRDEGHLKGQDRGQGIPRKSHSKKYSNESLSDTVFSMNFSVTADWTSSLIEEKDVNAEKLGTTSGIGHHMCLALKLALQILQFVILEPTPNVHVVPTRVIHSLESLNPIDVFRRFLSPVTLKNVPSKARHHRPLASTTLPTGYLLTGVHAGVKKADGVLDLGIILSTSSRPTSAAACFTRNAFKAAPVVVSQDVLERSGGRARAVVVNSGCANALTGNQGLDDTWAMAKATNSLLPAPLGQDETLVMSTGIIGRTLPISKVLAAIRSQHSGEPTRSLDSDFYAWERTAKAFMTTDTFPKLRSRVFTIHQCFTPP